MNRINEFGIEPGLYTDKNDAIFVVVEIVNNIYNAAHDMPEAITDPLVIVRHLENEKLEHVRYAFPLSIFQQKFKPYES